ncbi:uncharacterized protein LOC132547790 [Ylistrum balloti]|uniref:uncharacterized protein LOC132547790 n=1 Tax=Ylistrum balloti TaxID=509963 RepID=UPI002905EC91|nr:uncharacterized protein LOC132547790 [Ylistrum balloti]
MYVGEEFNSREELEARVVSLCQHYTSNTQGFIDNTGQEKKRVRFRCYQDGSIRVNVITNRELSHQQRTVASLCHFEIVTMTTKENGTYVVMTANLEHDHAICQEIYFQYPNIRRMQKRRIWHQLNKDQLEEVIEWLNTDTSNHPTLQRLYTLLKMSQKREVHLS